MITMLLQLRTYCMDHVHSCINWHHIVSQTNRNTLLGTTTVEALYLRYLLRIGSSFFEMAPRISLKWWSSIRGQLSCGPGKESVTTFTLSTLAHQGSDKKGQIASKAFVQQEYSTCLQVGCQSLANRIGTWRAMHSYTERH